MTEHQPDHHPEHRHERPGCGPARGRRPSVDWVGMDRWLVDSMGVMPRSAVLDIGPSGIPVDDGADVDCAQIQVLGARTYLVRLSTTLMAPPLLTSDTVWRSSLDRWFYEDIFDDCTHGFLMSRSRRRIAEIVVTWFRDRCRFVTPEELGCHYQRPARLPRATSADRRRSG
ncbi:hypothetical protein V1Y59_01510 [Gordonia sp. PKS22-38]|uniref:Uncharacterized protein n=1 Tax=Gordonia prachuapensis TaxID=3115651 RepID=A0ABU7MN56_9ACTN|nr:hypothetical protein [Gordonia sp. PKS22-38]